MAPLALDICPTGEPGLVSVVIPTFNRERELTRAIESVLAQTYPTLEIIVVDDGSTDDTRAVATRYAPHVRYIWQPNSGVSTARNAGLRTARGEFVALLDSDDEWQPWKLAAQIPVLRADASLGMVWSDMSAVDDTGGLVADRYLRRYYGLENEQAIETAFPPPRPLRQFWPDAPGQLASADVYSGDIFSRLILGNCVHTSTVVLRRERLRCVGGFDESLGRSGEDYEFHFHTCFFGPVAFVDLPTTRYRVGAGDQLSGTAYSLQIARSNLRTVEKWMRRGRSRIQVEARLLRWRLAESHAWIGEEALAQGDAATARRYLGKSLLINPRQPRRVIQLLASIAPARMVRSVRRLRARLRGMPLRAAKGLLHG